MLNLLFFPHPFKRPEDKVHWPVPEPQPKPISPVHLKYSENLAVVERAIVPSYKGRVKYQGVSWLAQCESNMTFYPGDRVIVTGRYNITLIVQPMEDEKA